jgi:VWFA-related protein
MQHREVLVSPAAVFVALAALLVPVTASPRIPQTPQFRIFTRLVEIGVIVRDKNGPVSGLTKSDFNVFDRGKPQPISLFFNDSAASAQQPPEQPLPPNTFSDLPQYGATAPRSVTIVLLDNLNTLYGSSAESYYEATPYWLEDLALQSARTHLVEFIKSLGPQDRVAIYGLRHSLHILCDFTSDRSQLLAILKNYDTSSVTNRAVVEPGQKTSPGSPDNGPGGIAGPFENESSLQLAGEANEDRAAETMAALQQIASHVANIPGRKNLVWLTANLPFSGAAMARVLSPADIAVYPIDARRLLAQSPMVNANIPGTADQDEESNGGMSRFDAHYNGNYSGMAQFSHPIGIDTMEQLADDSGGQAFVNTNDITGAIRSAVEDSAVTYTLGFYINRDALDGKFHNIKIEVRGNGLTVRYPKGYFAFPDTAPTKNEDQLRLMAAVQSPIESSSIPVQATVERVAQPPHWFKVVCSIDAHDLRLVQSGNLRKGAIDVYIVEQDATGKILLQSGKTFTLQFPEDRYAALLKSGLLFHELVQPNATATTLRILVEDPATSYVGSLIVPLSQVN